MILIKFVVWIFAIYLGLYLLWRIFGKYIARFAFRYLQRKAQEDMDRQSRVYERYAQGHNPNADSVYLENDVKVSVPKREKKKKKLDHARIETVDYEDVHYDVDHDGHID